MSTDVMTQAEPSVLPPGDWLQPPLTKVADIRFSGVNKVSQPSEEPVRLCNYIDVYNNDYITEDMDFMHATAMRTEIEQFALRIGDVIITKDSETPDDIGVPAVVDSTAPDIVCGYHLALIRPDQEEIDSTFLAKQLGHHRLLRYFGQQSNGSTRYGLSTAAISRAPLWLPEERDEQVEIGKILRHVDAAIAKTEAVIAKLKQVQAGLLDDLLTRGLNDNGGLRDPLAHPEQFKDSPLGPIPCSWSTQPLGKAADWFSGGTPSRAQAAWWQGDVPFLTPKDMKRFEVIDTIEHVSDEAARYGSRLMPVETLFIVVRGMILAHTFPVCLNLRPVAFNQDIKAIRGRDGLSTRFLAHWFLANSAMFLRKATEATHGTKKLDTPELHRMVIASPLPKEQQAIVDRLELEDVLIAREQEECAKLRLLKSGLMDDLLTGHVRVPETTR